MLIILSQQRWRGYSIIPSQQRWRGYSVTVRGWLGEWVCACIRPSRFTLWAWYRLQLLPNHFQTSHADCWWWEEEPYWLLVTGSKVHPVTVAPLVYFRLLHFLIHSIVISNVVSMFQIAVTLMQTLGGIELTDQYDKAKKMCVYCPLTDHNFWSQH